MFSRSFTLAGVEAAVSAFQPREPIVRLPACIDDAALFDVPLGTILDLRHTERLVSTAIPGLANLARRGPVTFRLIKGSQPFQVIENAFGVALLPGLGDETEYHLIP